MLFKLLNDYIFLSIDVTMEHLGRHFLSPVSTRNTSK